MQLSAEYQLHTAHTRPDLWDALSDPSHPLNSAWPRFLDNDLSQQYFANTILKYNSLRRYQIAITETSPADGRQNMIAIGRSCPFFWPELDDLEDGVELAENPDTLHSLPDGGWDTIVARGIRQHLMREGISTQALPILTGDQERDILRTCQTTHKPNALSALSITVVANKRGLGLAERLIETMRQTARQEGLRVLVAPLRPTRKMEFPNVRMDEYLGWTNTRNTLASNLQAAYRPAPVRYGPLPAGVNPNNKCGVPFDPWLRKHIRLGGGIAKVAPSSMVVQGSVVDWHAWTGIDVQWVLQNTKAKDLQFDLVSKSWYIEIPLPGGLVPLKVFVREQKCVYIEPNVWIYHGI